MDIPNDSIMERTTLRYLDSVSGERYHMIFNPPPTQQIKDRLVRKPGDFESAVSVKISEYYSNVDNLVDFYGPNALHINADQDPNIVFESIESGLVNQIPKSEIISKKQIDV